jgi:hypothetical protein
VNYPGPCSETDTSYDLEIAGCADLDTDLSDDHPVSFDYTTDGITADNLIDKNMFPQPVANNTHSWRMAILGASGTYYPLYGIQADNDWFECATCHSVHHTAPEYDPEGTHQVYFLRHDNTGSELCRDCHTNK